jgi:hypothetical protein
VRDIYKDLWTNANNYRSDNLFLLRDWISDIKDKTAGDATSYGWMDRPFESRGHPMTMPMLLPLLERSKTIPSSNWEVNDFVLLSCYLLL